MLSSGVLFQNDQISICETVFFYFNGATIPSFRCNLPQALENWEKSQKDFEEPMTFVLLVKKILRMLRFQQNARVIISFTTIPFDYLLMSWLTNNAYNYELLT